MLSLTHRDLLHFGQVARKTFGRSASRSALTMFHGNTTGTTLSMRHDGSTLTYHSEATQERSSAFAVRSGDLRSFERASDDGFVIRAGTDENACSIRSAMTMTSPVTRHHAEVGNRTEPIARVTLDAAVLTHLADCTAMADCESIRFALQCLQLDGNANAVAATDGRKALRVTNCPWPWDGTKLVPASGWFASSVVRKSATSIEVVDLGQAVRFTAGPWSLELPVRDGRFPDVARVFPAAAQTETVLTLTDEDRTIATAALKSFPKPRGVCANAVTLELGEPCRLCVAGDEDGTVAEVILPRATFAGPAMRAALPRHALTDVMRLGFTEVRATAAGKAFWCSDDNRQFAFMPLHPDFAVGPHDGSRPSRPKAA